jgi:hypothetical protein
MSDMEPGYRTTTNWKASYFALLKRHDALAARLAEIDAAYDPDDGSPQDIQWWVRRLKAQEKRTDVLAARLAEARMLLTKLSIEAGACSGMTGAREFLGNTNLACLELRVREAMEWLASIDEARAADSAGEKP